MSALLFLIVVCGIIALAFGAVVVVPLLAGSSKRELRAAKSREKIAVKTLRVIANGTSGNPALEAQIALDDIENNYIKELN
jgi:hypothetical protein